MIFVSFLDDKRQVGSEKNRCKPLKSLQNRQFLYDFPSNVVIKIGHKTQVLEIIEDSSEISMIEIRSLSVSLFERSPSVSFSALHMLSAIVRAFKLVEGLAFGLPQIGTKVTILASA